MNEISKKATGPTSSQGKAIASKNATKDAIFVKGLLPWEDPAALEQLMQELRQQWGDSASARLLMLSIEQAYVELQRLMLAQKNRIAGTMQSVNIARQFAQEAGIDVLTATQLPHWFFDDEQQVQKDWAIELDRAQEQALELKAAFHDRLVPSIAQDYPDLFAYVMEGYGNQHSFLTILGHRYKQPTPVLNLGAVSNEIGEKYRFHLIWASAPQRHEQIIRGLRAQQMIEAMNLDQFSRYLTRCQNAITKGIQSLALLKETLRLEACRQREAKQISMTVELAQTQSAANASSFAANAAPMAGVNTA